MNKKIKIPLKTSYRIKLFLGRVKKFIRTKLLSQKQPDIGSGVDVRINPYRAEFKTPNPDLENKTDEAMRRHMIKQAQEQALKTMLGQSDK